MKTEVLLRSIGKINDELMRFSILEKAARQCFPNSIRTVAGKYMLSITSCKHCNPNSENSGEYRYKFKSTLVSGIIIYPLSSNLLISILQIS